MFTDIRILEEQDYKMKENVVHFYSDGIKLHGAYYLPDDWTPDRNKPLIVAASGFMGLRNIHPERFARALTPKGYPCFGFDYRGFSPSEGISRRVVLEEQIRDIRNAATFASNRDDLRSNPMVLLGWGMAGGMILQAANGCPDLIGLISANGFFNGKRVQQTVREKGDWERFQNWLLKERQRAVLSADFVEVDPFDIYPLDPVTKHYVDNVLRKNPDFGGNVHSVLADSLLDFAPERNLAHLKDVPILIAHGNQNKLHPTVEPKSLYETYPGQKELYWVEGGGHTEWMKDDDPLFLNLSAKIAEWLESIQ